MKWTIKKPTEPGIYYYAPTPEEWDIYRVVFVQKITDPSRTYCEYRYCDSWNWEDVHDSGYDSIWWGPLPKPERPDEAKLYHL